ncbi:hypothetical protein [Endozoicomonas euniceicola]|uniref:Uncharacterized protein n=1 Tax=Endozoicomonas euniceicola TaxID=1234143 RepID=A0ABY6GPU8_9GAMM|nr:hypothetical protein [Endozoicomonas euniceicola]UYM14086.1 hypothetical protein NX720_14335 [Endozoicomonas euniceicola]
MSMEAARKIDVDAYALRTPEGAQSHKSPDGATVESGTVFGRDISTQSPEEKSASLPKSSANPLCQTLEGLTITRVGHPERFVAHPDMLGLEYLEEPGLDVKEVCKRIKQVRKGRINGQYEDEGLIYCKYVRDQQSALEQLGKAVEKNPVEVIFTMERGGTCLYDFLETYIPPVSRPAVVVSTAKEMELSSARHIEKMGREVGKAFHLGYRRIGVVEVSISGMQLHAIVKKLAECIDSLSDQNVEVHCFVLRQALSKRPYDQKERETKLRKLLERNPAVHVHVVETPFLLGEDVEQYLRYGSENQHPVNLVLPDRSLWQLHSHGGTRRTLKNLVAGKYNSFVPGLCSGASEPCLIPHRTIDSADLVKTVSEEKQLCSGWEPGRCFDYILENGWDAVPDEVNGKPKLSFHVTRERISNLKHWLEAKARDIDEKFRGMAPNEYMTHCQVEFDSLEVQELKPVLLKLCSQLAYHGQLDMTATFRRHRKKLLKALPLTEKLAAPKSNTHSKTPAVTGTKSGVAKRQSIDLVKEGVSLLEAADKVINGKLTPRYDANMSNFLNNKLTIFINNLSSQIVSDDLCDTDRSKLMDILNSVKRALLPVLKSMDKSKQTVKNKKTAEELSEVVDNCLTLLGPESASETTRRCFLTMNALMQGKLCRHWEFVQTPVQARAVREAGEHYARNRPVQEEPAGVWHYF